MNKGMENKKIVMLAGKGDSSLILYNAINSRYNIDAVILEDKENKKVFIKRRIKKLGIIKVAGQILFQVIIVRFLKWKARNRITEIISENNLNLNGFPVSKVTEVTSVNSNVVKDMLEAINPDLIIVNGTRIISKKILNAINCPIINTHTGITPMYRGVHGGYWALVNNDKENCGVTVHLVDAGIDTGGILYQDMISVTKKDNFVTYSYLQTAKAVPILLKAIGNALENNLVSNKKTGESKLWSHPTIWQYLYHFLFAHVK